MFFQDHVLVYGTSKKEHDKTLMEVLSRLNKAGLTIKPEKCNFGVKSVEYLGHSISSEGVKP